MKRKGYVYERMTDWTAVKIAERIAVKNKPRNFGVKLHAKQWLKNLIEIHENVLNHRMETSTYQHTQKVSGQGKLRDISKLDFHPSHIQHQLLVLATQKDIEHSLIDDTYASREGYGQHRCAKRVNDWVQEHYKEYPWYLQIDVVKYYDNIQHSQIRKELERRYKDKEYIDAYMETIEKFSTSGKKIPLGIRPSQIFGNLALDSVDRHIKHKMRIKYYCRYLDDMLFLLPTKADCWKVYNEVKREIEAIGFKLHEPKVHRVEHGIDYMGYVTYPKVGQFIRSSNVREWLKRRHGLTNKRRIMEVDSAFWGLMIHANKHSKRLYKMNGGIDFSALGIKKAESVDKNGRSIIDVPQVSMSVVLNRDIDILQVVEGVETKHGKDRMALRIELMGAENKLIVNSPNIKTFIADCWSKGVTKLGISFIDRGGKKYDIDYKRTSVKEINHRKVSMNEEGKVIYTDTKELVQL